jgi:uncharacterized protein YycO
MAPVLLLASLLCLSSCSAQKLPDLREGDILFQSLETSQSNAIALATHSKYTHVGMLLPHEGELMVYEAVGPVRYTPVEKWIKAGNGKHVVIRRLQDTSMLDQATKEKLREAAVPYLGKRYDFAFNWSDEELYCSELVWKIYKEGANIELGKPRALKTFDLSSPIVKQVMAKRYGDNVPYEEPMIAPQQVFESELLETVYEN